MQIKKLLRTLRLHLKNILQRKMRRITIIINTNMIAKERYIATTTAFDWSFPLRT